LAKKTTQLTRICAFPFPHYFSVAGQAESTQGCPIREVPATLLSRNPGKTQVFHKIGQSQVVVGRYRSKGIPSRCEDFVMYTPFKGTLNNIISS